MSNPIKNKWKRLHVVIIIASIITGMFSIFVVILNFYLSQPGAQNDSQPPKLTDTTSDSPKIDDFPDSLNLSQRINTRTTINLNEETNDSLPIQEEAKLGVDTLVNNKEAIYYNVTLIIPPEMLSCKIFVDNNDANIIQRNGVHIIIKIKGRQKSYNITIENDKYKFRKEVLIDKDTTLSFSTEDKVT